MHVLTPCALWCEALQVITKSHPYAFEWYEHVIHHAVVNIHKIFENCYHFVHRRAMARLRRNKLWYASRHRRSWTEQTTSRLYWWFHRQQNHGDIIHPILQSESLSAYGLTCTCSMPTCPLTSNFTRSPSNVQSLFFTLRNIGCKTMQYPNLMV